MITLLTFVLGLVFLAAGGELLIRSSSHLAQELGVSRLFIGLTVVAFGTSAPEAVVSVMAAIRGSTDLALGNVIGSNVFNVLFILGLSAIIMPLAVSAHLIRFDVPFLVAISALCLLLGLDGYIGILDGLMLLTILILHILLSYHKAIGIKSIDASKSIPKGLKASKGIPRPPAPWKGRSLNLLILLMSLILLVLGSQWLVSSASTMARWLGLSELVIGLTVIAAGTSVPEAATSVIAAMRGERDIAIGNIIGSCIFNILGVLGLGAILAPDGIIVPQATLAFDLPVMLAVAFLCLPIFFNKMTVFRWEGALLLGYFFLFMIYTLLNATKHDLLNEFTAVIGWVLIPLTILALAAITISNILLRVRLRKHNK